MSFDTTEVLFMMQQQTSNGGDGSALTRRRRSRGAKKRTWCRKALDGLLSWGAYLKAKAKAFARAVACFCRPVCAYGELLGVHVDAVTPARRSSSSAGGLSPVSAWNASPSRGVVVAQPGEGARRRSSFRERSLLDDVLMRRFVLAEEEETARRCGEMEVATRRGRRKWRAPGDSRLRHMSLAHVAEDEAGHHNGLS